MPKKRVLIPGDVVNQDFWNDGEFSKGHAFTDLYIITSDKQISVDKSFFLNRWGWSENNLDDFFDIPYIQDKFKIENLMGLISIERKNAQKLEDPEKLNLVDQAAEHILSEFNKVFGTRYRNYSVFIKNLEYWLDIYTVDEIVDAIYVAKKDEFWSDKMKPTILFRRANSAGQCDYIGDLLNKQRIGKGLQRSISPEDRTM